MCVCVCLCMQWILVDSHGHVGLVSYEFLCAFSISSRDVCNAMNAENKVVHLCSLSCFRSDVLCFYSSAQDMSPFFLSSNNSLKSVPVFQLSNTLIPGTKTGGSKKSALKHCECNNNG